MQNENLDVSCTNMDTYDVNKNIKSKSIFNIPFNFTGLLFRTAKISALFEILLEPGIFTCNLFLFLNLDTFFTSGPEESRAWTVKKNTLAPKAASVIHTDFEKNFIRAETVTCEDFIKYGSAEKCKENGKLRIEGKDYIVKDGDVLFFRVNT